MQQITNALEKIFEKNFWSWLYKYTYLYNELFISIAKNNDFSFFWITYKFDKIHINSYRNSEIKNNKLLIVLLKKYEKIFINIIKEQNKKLSTIWEETDFINIYDNKELSYNDVKKILSFSFLDDYSYRRKIQNDFHFEDQKILDIYHSDFECSKCNWPKDTFTNFSDYNKKGDEKYFKINKRNKTDFLFTNISEYESIAIWWNEKINEILQDKKLIKNYDLISLNKTCISVIMWDDIESIFKYNKISPKKIFYTDQNIDSPYKTVINYLKNIDLKEAKKTQELLFFWLNKNKNTYELVSFLKENFSIIVWNTLLPNISKSDLEMLLDYKLLVFFKWREIKAQNIFKLYPVDNFETLIPYWIKKLREFTQNILEKYNKLDKISIFDVLVSNYKQKYNDLYIQSSKIQVWFVVSDFNIKYFIQDNLRWVPILSMLWDMWFILKFFIFPQSKIDYYLNEFKNLNYDYTVSDKEEDLENFLRNQNIQLYYSEISNDQRILSLNKQLFSVWDLEYWIEWFYRSFQLLIKKSNISDYFKNIK